MSIRARRQSLLKSSISIKSMRNSVAAFNKGLQQAKKNAAEIVKTTKESNIFKRTLISRDNNFFRKRQENIRRKDREDEIEAVSLSGALKRRGTILAKSTRGFLGRMLDFVGILLIGWALNNLPRIIKALSGLINLIRRVVGILGSFINTIKNIVVGIGSIISDAISKLPSFDFGKNKRGIEENLERATGGLTRLDQQLVQSGNDFVDFGDELDQQYDQELKEAEKQGLIEGTPSTSDGDKGQKGEEEDVKKSKEEIGFNVDSIIKSKDQEKQEEEKDPTENIKPRKTSSTTENVGMDDSKLDIKKIADDEIEKADNNTNNIKEEDVEKEAANVTKGRKVDPIQASKKEDFTLRPTDTGNERKDKFNEKINELKLQKKYGGTGRPFTIGGKTYNPGDEGYLEAFNSTKGVTSRSGAIVPIRRERSKSVRSNKKKKGDTIFIVEKKVPVNNTQPMMANSGSNLRLNNLGEFDDNKTLMKLQSTSTLKYT